MITNKRVVVVPAGKDYYDLAVIGVFLGGGVIAAGIINSLTDWWARKAPREIDVAQQTLAHEVLARCAIWDRNTLTFQIFEERTAFDLLGGEWATCPRISGPCQYQSDLFEAGVEFSFYGRIKNLPFRSRPKEVGTIAKLFNFNLDSIQRRSIWRIRDS